MSKSCWEIDDNGLIIEHYLYDDEEIKQAEDEGRIIIDRPWTTPFFNPKFNFDLNDWEEGKSPEDILEIAKTEKMSKLNTQCSETILGKFPALVDGVNYYFSNDMEAQANFEKADKFFTKGMLASIMWTAYDESGQVTRLDLDQEAFEDVYLSHVNFIQNNISRFRDQLMPLVLNATSVQEINSVTWDVLDAGDSVKETVDEPAEETVIETEG